MRSAVAKWKHKRSPLTRSSECIRVFLEMSNDFLKLQLAPDYFDNMHTKKGKYDLEWVFLPPPEMIRGGAAAPPRFDTYCSVIQVSFAICFFYLSVVLGW